MSTDLTELRHEATRWSLELRAHRDQHPVVDPAQILHLEGVHAVATASVPEEYGGVPVRIDGRSVALTTAAERVVVMEELAWGDLDIFMAAPGPSMSGQLIELLGDDSQKQRYYSRLVASPTWTFFALTEKDHGSDAGAMGTSVRSEAHGTVLRGEKWYVGGGCRAAQGVVFARNGRGPLSIDVLLVDTDRPGYRAEPIRTLGVVGAGTSRIVLDDVPVDDADILGRHLPRSRRGLRAGLEVFNRLRPGVAALALGVARVAVDAIAGAAQGAGPRARTLRDEAEALTERADGVRAVVLDAAHVVDSGGAGHLASAAKALACELAEDASLAALRLLDPSEVLADPRLLRCVVDARGVEFMEGTRNIQQLHVFQALNSGRPGF